MGGALDAPEPPQSPEVSETRAAAAHPSGCTLRVPTLAAARRPARAHANG